MNDLAALEAQATVTDRHVIVSFTFTNLGPEELYVYAHPDDGRRAEVLPGAYVCVAREERALHVLLGVPPAPRHYDVLRGVIPLARLLLPGARFEGQVVLERPVREWSAYLPTDAPPDCPTVYVDGGWVRVEYFPTSEAGWVEPGPEEGTYWSEAEQPRTLTAEFAFTEPVPVLERTDPFVRF